MLQRLVEEKLIVEQEVKSLLTNCMSLHTKLDEKIVKEEPLTQLERGCKAICVKQQHVLAARMATIIHLFPHMHDVSVLVPYNPPAVCLTDADISELGAEED